MTRGAVLLAAAFASACSFQIGAPTSLPRERVVRAESTEQPAGELHTLFDQSATHVRVEAHRLCSDVTTREMEQVTEYDRSLPNARIARGAVVVGVVLVIAGLVGVAAPDVLAENTDGALSSADSRLAAGGIAGAGGVILVGGAAPLIAARRPAIRRQLFAVTDPPSSAHECTTPLNDAGLAVELIVDGVRVSVGQTDSFGILEFGLAQHVPPRYAGAIVLVVDGQERAELDISSVQSAQVAQAITLCSAAVDEACAFLARFQETHADGPRTREIEAVLAEARWRRLDRQRCLVARHATDCADVTTFLQQHPTDRHARDAAELLERGRVHAIEQYRTSFSQ